MNTGDLKVLKDAEKYVLGQCMTDINAYHSIESIIKTSDFLTIDHQLVFNAIRGCVEENGSVDPLVVAQYLKNIGNDQLNRVGGPEYLYELQAPIVETENVVKYAQIIREESQKRQLTAVLKSASNSIEDDDSPERIITELEECFENIFGHNKTKLNRISIYDLCQEEVTPIDWIIPDIIPSGLTVLAGDSKVGKSFFCWNIALALATGGMALSSINIEEPRNVLYLALEDPRNLIRQRLDMIRGEDRRPRNLEMLNNIGNLKFDKTGMKVIKREMDECEADVLIVDTWKFVEPDTNTKGTSYDVDYAKMSEVHKFCHSNNISMILVTHTRKSADVFNPFNRIQGSTGIQAGCDTLMILEKDGDDRILSVTGRQVLPNEYCLYLDNGTYILKGEKDEVQHSEQEAAILNVLKEIGPNGMKAGDIAGEIGVKDAGMTLKRMKNKGHIVQPKRGVYIHKLYIED